MDQITWKVGEIRPFFSFLEIFRAEGGTKRTPLKNAVIAGFFAA